MNFPNLITVVFNSSVFSWWLLIEILGLAALPIAFHTMRWLPDRGYTFAKALGLLIASYILWIGAMTGFLRNDTGGILFAILAVFGLSALALLFRPRQSSPKRSNLNEFLDYLNQNKRLILIVELLFAAAFILWVIVRAYAPDKVMNAGGEKFMEMTFLNGVLSSSSFPPLDPWLSGFGISYYYFGYVMMGLLTRFSAVPAGIGFELYGALLFALATLGSFGIVYNLVAHRVHSLNYTRDISQARGIHPQPVVYGILGAILVVVMGNLEGLLESIRTRGLLPDSFWRWIDIPGLADSAVTGSWTPSGGFFGCCWRASRVLQDYDLLGQPVGVSPITEFPNFSFLLGDNHPHILALPFVLFMIALAFNLLLRQRSYPTAELNDLPIVEPSQIPSRTAGQPLSRLVAVVMPTFKTAFDWILLLFYAFCLGALGFLNTWDMPIYLGLIVLAYGAGEYTRQSKLDWMLFLRVIMLAIFLLVASLLFYILFYLGFQSQAGGILPYVFQPTRLPQYLVMFGVFIYILIWFLGTAFSKKVRQQGAREMVSALFSAWGWIIFTCAAIIVIFLIFISLLANSKQMQNPVVQSVVGSGPILEVFQRFIAARLTNPWLFLLLSSMLAMTLVNLIVLRNRDLPNQVETTNRSETHTEASSTFSLLLIFIGIALTLSVELFYLRDSFGVRMNTVFKFYYQAWIMLGCASTYAIYWILNPTRSATEVEARTPKRSHASRPKAPGAVGRTIFLVGAVLLITAGMVYPMIAGYARVDGLRSTPNLDGTINLVLSNPDDWAAIAWLTENKIGTPTILEAPGKSYNYEGRISAFSGLPAVLGWAYHEAQWRGNYDEQGLREPDIQTIYTTKSAETALELLHKWNVKYVIVGDTEIAYIQQLCAEASRACNLTRALRKFETALAPVFQQGNITIYEVPDAYEP